MQKYQYKLSNLLCKTIYEDTLNEYKNSTKKLTPYSIKEIDNLIFNSTLQSNYTQINNNQVTDINYDKVIDMQIMLYNFIQNYQDFFASSDNKNTIQLNNKKQNITKFLDILQACNQNNNLQVITNISVIYSQLQRILSNTLLKDYLDIGEDTSGLLSGTNSNLNMLITAYQQFNGDIDDFYKNITSDNENAIEQIIQKLKNNLTTNNLKINNASLQKFKSFLQDTDHIKNDKYLETFELLVMMVNALYDKYHQK